MRKVSKTDYPAIADMYNSKGREATYAYISEHYGICYPDRIIAKLKKSPEFTFDTKENKFRYIESDESDKLFMSLDELCSPMVTTHIYEKSSNFPAASNEAMDELIRSLISDRLLELSKYILLDTMTRTIMVDRSSMAADGYKVLIH